MSTMPRRIARVRVNWLNSVSPSPRRIARVSVERSSLKRPSISSTASLLARKTSRHMVGSDAAMRVKSRKPPAENCNTSERVTWPRSSAGPTMGSALRRRTGGGWGWVGGGGGGGRVVGGREPGLLVRGLLVLDLAADEAPERRQPLDRLG